MKLNISNVEDYVTSLMDDIYCVKDLPEEVIAVLFAYVSRSHWGVRENLLKVTKEKAQAFHEKWVLNYGHSSVSELAVVHVGIENVSRLFSSLLERSSLYISFIEYSQRYQKPKFLRYYIPKDIKEIPSLKKEYMLYQNNQYHRYEELLGILGSYYNEFNKKNYEDARYILTLGYNTSLGLTSNGRAMEECLNYLLSSEYEELRIRGQELKEHVLKQLPTLIKRVGEKDKIDRVNCLRNNLFKGYNDTKDQKEDIILDEENIKLLSYTGKGANEEKILDQLLIKLYYSYKNKNLQDFYKDMDSMDLKEKIKILDTFFKEFNNRDKLPNAFEYIRYEFELTMSESCWHQLLRHRQLQIIWKYPSVKNGYFIPQTIRDSKGLDIFESGIEESEKIYNKLNSNFFQSSHYVITNAHKRNVIVEFSLRNFFYLFFLRTKKNVQYEIKSLILKIRDRIKKVHPYLMSKLKDK